MASIQELLSDPAFQLGMHALAAGGPQARPMSFGQRALGAVGGFNEMQQAQQAAQLRQQEVAQTGQLREMQLTQAAAQQKRAEEQEQQRQVFMQVMRENPNMAPGDITRLLMQQTGDPNLLRNLTSGQQAEKQPTPPYQREVSLGGGRTQTFQWNPETRQHDIAVGEPFMDPRQATMGRQEAAADVKRVEYERKQGLQVTKAVDGLSKLEGVTRQLLDSPGLVGIYGVRGQFPDIPGGEAANARVLLDTLKSRGGLKELQELKAAGGTLGQVSNFENQMLQNSFEALQTTQSVDQAQMHLQRILEGIERARGNLANAYNVDLQSVGGAATPQPASVAPQPVAPTTAPGAPPTAAPTGAAAPMPSGERVMSEADLRATAMASGKTVEEVRAAAQKRGFTVR